MGEGGSHRSLRIDQQQVFGQAVVHPRQDIRARVCGALPHQEVSVVEQQFLGLAAAHLSVVPRLVLQLLLSSQGGRAHQQRTGVIHGRRFMQWGWGSRSRSLGHDGVLKRLWWQMARENNLLIVYIVAKCNYIIIQLFIYSWLFGVSMPCQLLWLFSFVSKKSKYYK